MGGNKIEIIKFICQINSDFSTTHTHTQSEPRIARFNKNGGQNLEIGYHTNLKQVLIESELLV